MSVGVFTGCRAGYLPASGPGRCPLSRRPRITAPSCIRPCTTPPSTPGCAARMPPIRRQEGSAFVPSGSSCSSIPPPLRGHRMAIWELRCAAPNDFAMLVPVDRDDLEEDVFDATGAPKQWRDRPRVAFQSLAWMLGVRKRSRTAASPARSSTNPRFRPPPCVQGPAHGAGTNLCQRSRQVIH